MAETILIIDDQENLRTLLKDYFSEQGYRVVSAKDGQEGLFVARYENPDIVLLDINRPDRQNRRKRYRPGARTWRG